MIRVKLEGFKAMQGSLRDQAKQVAYAASRALNATAKKVADAMPAEIESAIDKPTPFTKRGVRVLGYANKKSMASRVGFMTAQAKYMQLQVDGGARAAGPHGIKLPGNVTLNAFGNIPRGLTAQLKEAAASGALSKAIGRKLGVGDRRKGAAPIQLFYGKPTGQAWANAPIGIWRRIPGNPGKLVPVIIFSGKPAQYKPRFDFHKKATAVVEREWQQQFASAFADAQSTAR